MRQRVWSVSTCLTVMALWLCLGDGPIGRRLDLRPEARGDEASESAAEATPKAPALPPLKVDADAPLLLDDAAP